MKLVILGQGYAEKLTYQAHDGEQGSDTSKFDFRRLHLQSLSMVVSLADKYRRKTNGTEGKLRY